MRIPLLHYRMRGFPRRLVLAFSRDRRPNGNWFLAVHLQQEIL